MTSIVVLMAAVALVARFPVPPGRWSQRCSDAATAAESMAIGLRCGEFPQRIRVCASCVLAVATGVCFGVVAAVITGLASYAGLTVVVARRRAKAVETDRTRVQEAVAVVAAELGAGRPPDQALATAASVPGCSSLGQIARHLTFGGEIAQVRVSAEGAGPPAWAWQRLSVAWAVSEGCGAPLADVTRCVADELRSADRRRRAVAVELAGVRATIQVLALLPVLGLALGQGIGAHPLHVLLHTPLGAVCVALGAMFEVAGLLWARRLTRWVQGSDG